MRIKVFTVFFIVSILSACGPPPRVAVEERTIVTAREEAEKIGGSVIRIVEPGDTLHAIAFSVGLNVNELAAWNQLADTSKLQIGQRIRLTRPLNFVPVKARPIVNKNRDIKAVPVATQEPQTKPRPERTQPGTNQAAPTLPNPSRWYWPTKGQVIKQFSTSSGQQGIDISGRLGQPVFASSEGEVVYVGNGLKGYGNLIIIKHSEQFLSAYAHNQEYFVREGEQVKARQTIASLGKNNQQVNAIHFQIRKDGKPVNPQRYLPSK